MYVLSLAEVTTPGKKTNCEDDTILDLWGVGPNRPPIDTHHPAVRTHPVTGLKALNVNTGFVAGFAELNKTESGPLRDIYPTSFNPSNIRSIDKLLDFFAYHLHSADDHYVRWKWEVGSVAMWDNRCVRLYIFPCPRNLLCTSDVLSTESFPDSISNLEGESELRCLEKSVRIFHYVMI